MTTDLLHVFCISIFLILFGLFRLQPPVYAYSPLPRCGLFDPPLPHFVPAAPPSLAHRILLYMYLPSAFLPIDIFAKAPDLNISLFPSFVLTLSLLLLLSLPLLCSLLPSVSLPLQITLTLLYASRQKQHLTTSWSLLHRLASNLGTEAAPAPPATQVQRQRLDVGNAK